MKQCGPRLPTPSTFAAELAAKPHAIRPKGPARLKVTTKLRPVEASRSGGPHAAWRVAQTCATCHSDQRLMSGRIYHEKGRERPIGSDQYQQWRQSVQRMRLAHMLTPAMIIRIW